MKDYIKCTFSVIMSIVKDKHVLGSAKCWLSVRVNLFISDIQSDNPLVLIRKVHTHSRYSVVGFWQKNVLIGLLMRHILHHTYVHMYPCNKMQTCGPCVLGMCDILILWCFCTYRKQIYCETHQYPVYINSSSEDSMAWERGEWIIGLSYILVCAQGSACSQGCQLRTICINPQKKERASAKKGNQER